MPFRQHDAATHALTRAENLLKAASTAGLPPAVAADIRRSALVLAVAAVDTYMHRLIVDRADMWDALPPKLAETEVRLDQLVEEAQASYRAARRPAFNNRPGVRVKNVLRNQLLLKTFQTQRQIEDALTMAGASGMWGAIGQQLGMTTKQISRRLSPIVLRRNQIAHEGDYRRLDRRRNPNLNGITHAEVLDDIQFLRGLVNAIHAAV
jgi:hypothetical protein